MTMSDVWVNKIRALLHDPPNKPFGIQRHEVWTADLYSSMGLGTSIPLIVKHADVMAAASDRSPILSREQRIDWNREPVFSHPISSTYVLPGNKATSLYGEIEKVALSDLVREASNNMKDAWIEKLSNDLSKVHERFKGDRKKEFFYLWRALGTSLLMPDLSETQAFFLSSVLPADTRIPDHSIFDHLVTSSAMIYRNICLIGVDIGGVQEFISQGRKVRDLWAGSYLVSLMALRAMIKVAEELGPDAIIYPDLRVSPLFDLYLLKEGVLSVKEVKQLWGDLEKFTKKLLIPAIPGTFLIIAPEDQGDRIKEIVEKELREIFPKIAERVISKLRDLKNFGPDSLINRQLKGIPFPLEVRVEKVSLEDVDSLIEEIRSCENLSREEKLKCVKQALRKFIPSEVSSWGEHDLIDDLAEVILPEGDKYDLTPTFFYPIAYLILQARMGFRKIYRSFKEPEEPGEEKAKISKRCRLCGVRNPLHGEDSWAREGWNRIVEELRKNSESGGLGWLLSYDEPLCAVCLVKRLLRSREILLEVLEEVIDGSLPEELVRSLRESIDVIPTIDDIAAMKVREGLRSSFEELKDRLLKVLSGLVKFFIENMRELGFQERDTIEYVISELGWRISEFSKALAKMSPDLAAEEVKKVLESRLMSIYDVPGTYLFPSVWENVERVVQKRDKKLAEEVMLLRDLLKEEVNPSNYVALVYLDGDDLGKWISGRMFVEKGILLKNRLYPSLRNQINAKAHRLMTPSLHRTMSRILANLSIIYPEIVEDLEDLKGTTFYSGGDDLLAIVPAEDALKLVERVIKVYRSELISTGRGYVLGMGHDATMSGGVVLAHRLIPMGEMIKSARKEEKVAKGEDEEDPPGIKNQVSFTRLSRALSKERAVVNGDLIFSGEVSDLLEELDLMIVRKEVLSKGFLHDMLWYFEKASHFSEPGHSGSIRQNRETIQDLVKMCLARNLHADKEEKDELLNRLLNKYMALLDWSLNEGITELENTQMVQVHKLMIFLRKEVFDEVVE